MPTPPADEVEHRRLLVGDLMFRRIAYRSVMRMAVPFFAALYAIGVVVGIIGWNVAALAGWSPERQGLEGEVVLVSGVAAGVLVVPLLAGLSLALAALYNVVSRSRGGIEIAVISPRRRSRRHDDL